MKYRFLAVIPVLLLLYFARAFTFCSTNQSCPAYNDSVWVKWMPYTQGQRIIFTDGGSGRDTIHIASVTKSEATTTRSEAPVHCRSSATVQSSETDGSNEHRLDIYHHISDNGVPEFSITFHNFNVYASTLNDAGVVPRSNYPQISYQTYNNYTLGSHTYTLVQMITTTDTVAGRPYKLYLSPGTGIAGYEQYPDHKTWSLQ